MKDKAEKIMDNLIDYTVLFVILMVEPVLYSVDIVIYVINSWIELGKKRYRVYKAKKTMKNYGE